MGIIFLFLLVPFGGFLSYLSGKLRLKTAVISDRRINLMTEIVAGIRHPRPGWRQFAGALYEKEAERSRTNIEQMATISDRSQGIIKVSA